MVTSFQNLLNNHLIRKDETYESCWSVQSIEVSFDADGKMLELAASLDVADVVEEDGSGKSKPCSSLVFPSCDESLR